MAPAIHTIYPHFLLAIFGRDCYISPGWTTWARNLLALNGIMNERSGPSEL